MSHEVESMFYVGEVPWHGLGTFLDNPPTVEDAIRLAGLDWKVDSIPLILDQEGEEKKYAPAFANVRASDRSVLGVVGKTYEPLQNIDAFKWFQPFLDEGKAVLETAGSLREGKHIWILARLNHDPIEVVPGDPVKSYIMLSNSHNGAASIRTGFTGVRVVCANTMAMAHEDRGSKLLKVRHTTGAVEAINDVRETMDLAHETFVATTDWMKQMARKGVTVETLKEYVKEVFEPKLSLDDDTARDKVERKVAKIIPLFEHGRGNDMPGVQGTMWAAYNAITEHLNWEQGRSADTRLENLWLGNTANVAKRAFDVAKRMSVAA